MFAAPARFSHWTGLMIAFVLAGIVVLVLSVLQALLAFGPLACQSAQPEGATDPFQFNPSQFQPGPMNCDLGVTPAEQAGVVQSAITGVSIVLAGFVLGIIDKLAQFNPPKAWVRRHADRPNA